MKGRLDAARRRQGDSDLRRHARGTLEEAQLRALSPDHRVNAMGTFCPEPVIRTQKQAARMEAGEVLELIADDAGVEVDIPAWCLSTGNEYLGVVKQADAYRVFIRRS
ncbi:MAG: sulfurtransferase TusA family protein [Acidobacteriota bacterium]